jgi:hypothetical protein
VVAQQIKSARLTARATSRAPPVQNRDGRERTPVKDIADTLDPGGLELRVEPGPQGRLQSVGSVAHTQRLDQPAHR